MTASRRPLRDSGSERADERRSKRARSTGRPGKKHPYYLCHNRACPSCRKSIPRNRVEGDFAELLHGLVPTRTMFSMAKDMFRTAWDMRYAHMNTLKEKLRAEVVKIERQIEQLVDRIVDSESSTAVRAYEQRIAKLERERLIASERLQDDIGPQRPFNEMFELALVFLSNPWKLWASERLEDKRTVLKLTFADRLAYSRESGFRTAKTTIPFNMLGGLNMRECELARPKRFELLTPRFVVWCSIQLSYGRAPGRSSERPTGPATVSGRRVDAT